MALKLCQKLWHLYTKSLRNHVADKGHFVSCRVFGNFTHWANLNEDGSTKVCFVPSAESVEQIKLDYVPKYPFNMEFSSLEAIIRDKILNADCHIHRVNY